MLILVVSAVLQTSFSVFLIATFFIFFSMMWTLLQHCVSTTSSYRKFSGPGIQPSQAKQKSVWVRECLQAADSVVERHNWDQRQGSVQQRRGSTCIFHRSTNYLTFGWTFPPRCFPPLPDVGRKGKSRGAWEQVGFVVAERNGGLLHGKRGQDMYSPA